MKKGLLIAIFMIVIGALIAYAAPPLVTLTGPSDNYDDNDGDVTFEYTVSDDLNNITKCDLWTNISSVWALTATDTSISMGANSFTRTGIDDETSFLWNVECTDSEANSVFASANRTVNVKYPKLIVNDLKVYVDGDKHSGIDEDCVDTICDIEDDIYPGSEIKVFIELKNMYDEDTHDIDIEDIEIEGVLEEVDDGSDIDDTADINRLRAEEDDPIELVFEIPLIVEDGVYDLTIDIEAEDEDGNDQGLSFEFDVDISKKSHQVLIQRAEFMRDTLSCTRDTRLEVEVLNIGARDEDEVEILVENDALGINMRKTNVPELESDPDGDNEYETSFNINIDEDAYAGTYPVSVTVFFSEDVHSDEVDVDLIIQDCATRPQEDEEDDSADEEESDEEDDSADDLYDENVPDYILQEFGVTESVETSFKDSTAYIVLLIVAIVAAIGSITLLIVLLLRR
ncbi:hypothetical protein KY343_00495 [Candidatus Woesearchaeota archaeon]|nr:hypothetical protein [Candidatus Woesearchaeota archaeon]